MKLSDILIHNIDKHMEIKRLGELFYLLLLYRNRIDNSFKSQLRILLFESIGICFLLLISENIKGNI